MLDTVILLTGPVDETVLAAVLQRHNPALAIRSVKTLAELEAIDGDTLARARLVAFVTPVIVPGRASSIGSAMAATISIPGPPHYPGWVPSHLAVYERATQYGATAHRMTARVDAGPIVDVGLFAVPPGTVGARSRAHGVQGAGAAVLAAGHAAGDAGHAAGRTAGRLERPQEHAPDLRGAVRDPGRYHARTISTAGLPPSARATSAPSRP